MSDIWIEIGSVDGSAKFHRIHKLDFFKNGTQVAWEPVSVDVTPSHHLVIQFWLHHTLLAEDFRGASSFSPAVLFGMSSDSQVQVFKQLGNKNYAKNKKISGAFGVMSMGIKSSRIKPLVYFFY